MATVTASGSDGYARTALGCEREGARGRDEDERCSERDRGGAWRLLEPLLRRQKEEVATRVDARGEHAPLILLAGGWG